MSNWMLSARLHPVSTLPSILRKEGVRPWRARRLCVVLGSWYRCLQQCRLYSTYLGSSPSLYPLSRAPWLAILCSILLG